MFYKFGLRLERLSKDKWSSLLGLSSVTKKKGLITLKPGANVIKLFTVISYELS
jgi:hypothetical protein